ncbi:unnamed protein product [Somion occarium]|uniref:Uncharacterized protein n=1 Tax=Somion occarium TaxID=3059160 RepID=A0ABP1DZV5_9APHY
MADHSSSTTSPLDDNLCGVGILKRVEPHKMPKILGPHEDEKKIKQRHRHHVSALVALVMNILRYWMEPLELLRHLSLEHSRRGPMDRTIASWHLKIKLKKKSCWGIMCECGQAPDVDSSSTIDPQDPEGGRIHRRARLYLFLA